MVAGHMTKKNGYWYLILMVRDETGRLKQKWISTHLRVEGNKKKAEAVEIYLKEIAKLTA